MPKQPNPAGFAGASFPGLLGLLFIGLKLTGYISWSWWWVLAPLWAPFAIAVVVAVALLVAASLSR